MASQRPRFSKKRIKLHLVDGQPHAELRDGDALIAEYHDYQAVRDIRAGLINLSTSRLTRVLWKHVTSDSTV